MATRVLGLVRAGLRAVWDERGEAATVVVFAALAGAFLTLSRPAGYVLSNAHWLALLASVRVAGLGLGARMHVVARVLLSLPAILCAARALALIGAPPEISAALVVVVLSSLFVRLVGGGAARVCACCNVSLNAPRAGRALLAFGMLMFIWRKIAAHPELQRA